MKNIFLFICITTKIIAVPAVAVPVGTVPVGAIPARQLYNSLITRQEIISEYISAASALAVSDDGTLLALGSSLGHIAIWNLSENRCIEKMRGEWFDSINSLLFTPDNKKLIHSGNKGRIAVWNLNPLSWRGSSKDRVIQLSWPHSHRASPSLGWSDHFLLANYHKRNGQNRISHFMREENFSEYGGRSGPREHGEIFSVLSPHGTKKASALQNKTIMISPAGDMVFFGFDTYILNKFEQPVAAMAFDNPGDRLAVLESSLRDIGVWDLSSRTKIMGLLAMSEVGSIALHSESNRLIGSYMFARKIKVWDLDAIDYATDCFFIEKGGLVKNDKIRLAGDLSLYKLATLAAIHHVKKLGESHEDVMRKIKQEGRKIFMKADLG